MQCATKTDDDDGDGAAATTMEEECNVPTSFQIQLKNTLVRTTLNARSKAQSDSAAAGAIAAN